MWNRTTFPEVLTAALLPFPPPPPQAKALKVDWKDPINRPVTPKLLGTKAILEFPIQDLLEYIDWNPFFQVWGVLYCGVIKCNFIKLHSVGLIPCFRFSSCAAATLSSRLKPECHPPSHIQVWQLRGRYPNRGYPKIFNDATVGGEAKKLFDEAQVMLQDFVTNKRVKLNAVIGLYPASAVGDDIEVYEDESRTVVKAKMYGLRQQVWMG